MSLWLFRYTKLPAISCNSAVKMSDWQTQSKRLLLAGVKRGCGKTTTGRCILQLYRITAGKVLFEGKDLNRINGKELRNMQLIFQDPLDVRWLLTVAGKKSQN